MADKDEGSRARAARNAPGFGAALGALADLLTSGARGTAKTTLGMFGDLERLGKLAIDAGASTRLGAPLSWNVPNWLEAAKRAEEYDTVVPSSKDFDRWLPPATTFSIPKQQNPMEAITEWAPLTPTQALRVAGAAAKPVAKLAAEAVHRGVTEGRGPLGALQASIGPSYAVRPRGGNFDQRSVDQLTNALHVWEPEIAPGLVGQAQRGHGVTGDRERAINQWIDTQLANYVKKDLGSPADPLLQVEQELPNLHLQPGWQVDERALRHVNEHGTTIGSSLKGAEYVDTHRALTGGKPITPWGYYSDQAIDYELPLSHAERLLGDRFRDAGDYADHLYRTAAAKGLVPGTDPKYFNNPRKVYGYDRTSLPFILAENFARGDPNNVIPVLSEHSADVARPLLEHFAAERAKVVPPWLDKAPPQTKIWGISSDPDAAIEDLGFNHIVDYLNQATGAHTDLQLPGFTPAELRQRLAAPQNNLDRAAAADYRRQLALHDAGLALDPRSLGRLSVADAVRKTAAWNDLLENGMGGLKSPDLERGIVRVHKEYPDTGLKWVELGNPHPRSEGPPSAEWLSGKDDLAAGLNAEGEAMGHCVGGYCDDVAQRGTKIYSLRDAAGNPHVTIEARPSREMLGQLETMPDPSGVYENLHQRVQRERHGDGDYDTYATKLLGELGISIPEDIIQIKGKQNAAPVAKYLPAVQDFVRSREWGRVGDLRNTGLVRAADAPAMIDYAHLMSGKQLNEVLRGVGDDPGKYWAQSQLDAANAAAAKLLEQTGVPVRRGSKLHELIVQAHQKAGVNPLGNQADFSGLYSPRELSQLGQYVAPDENLDFLRAMIQNARTDKFPNELQLGDDFYAPLEPDWSPKLLGRYAEGGVVEPESEPKFMQRLFPGYAGGGKVVRKVLERVGETLPELGRAGASTLKAERIGARSSASFEELARQDPAAVRARGGNFFDWDLGSYLGNEQLRVPETKYDPPYGTSINVTGGDELARVGPVADWAETQLANYLRKDLGSPADPLLQVEKDLPGLHMPPDWLPDANIKLQELKTDASWGERGRPNRYKKAFDRLKTHNELTGGTHEDLRLERLPNHEYGLETKVPLTPWGLHSDLALKSYTPQQLFNYELGDALELLTPPAGVQTHSTGVPVGGSGLSLLKAYAEHPDNAPVLGKLKWLADAPPDTKVWGLADRDSDSLNFSHVLDYLEQATRAHETAGIRGWADQLEPLPHYQRDRALYDAGLTLDPRSLGRLSVADAVRKTAAWNEHLAKAGAAADPDLARGIARVHKEYPDEGMRWVELGAPESVEPIAKLPEGYRTAQLPDDPLWRVLGPDGVYTTASTPELAEQKALEYLNQAAKTRELEAGLNAEGKAMGHCVGGYCDDVAERGTKIYSLRDKAGNPHVTVEVRPRKTADSAFNEDSDDYEQVMAQLESELNKRPTQNPEGPRAGEYGRAGFSKTRTALHDWLDFTAESGDHRAAMRWLKESYPDLHEQFNAPVNINDIIQIKGKQNAAPVDKYLPYVQDFVKSGQWGHVGDLGNTRLRSSSDVFNPNELRGLTDLGHDVPSYLTADDIARLQDAFTKKLRPEGYATGGAVVGSRFEAALAARR